MTVLRNRMGVCGSAIALCGAVLLGLAATPTGATTPIPAARSTNSVTAQSPFHVLYSPAAAAFGPNLFTDPGAPPVGANNWSCQPSAAHPDPVVLVHGLGATMAENWSTFSPLLADNGYCVFALTYGLDAGESYVGGLQLMEESSHQLADFVNRVLVATGAKQVDLVGHSEGTVMPQYYLKFLGGAVKVHRYVAITPLYEGTTLDGVSTLLGDFETLSPAGAAPVPAPPLRQRRLCRARRHLHGHHDQVRRSGDPVYLGPVGCPKCHQHCGAGPVCHRLLRASDYGLRPGSGPGHAQCPRPE
jgi:pimeloyl-ACP methyl ester carboxylesterase